MVSVPEDHDQEMLHPVHNPAKGSYISYTTRLFFIFLWSCCLVEDWIIYLVYLINVAKEKAAQEKAAKEEAEEEAEANKKRHLNVVFIGHVGMVTYLIFFHQFNFLYW